MKFRIWDSSEFNSYHLSLKKDVESVWLRLQHQTLSLFISPCFPAAQDVDVFCEKIRSGKAAQAVTSCSSYMKDGQCTVFGGMSIQNFQLFPAIWGVFFYRIFGCLSLDPQPDALMAVVEEVALLVALRF